MDDIKTAIDLCHLHARQAKKWLALAMESQDAKSAAACSELADKFAAQARDYKEVALGLIRIEAIELCGMWERERRAVVGASGSPEAGS